jgi:hypothetical protein
MALSAYNNPIVKNKNIFIYLKLQETTKIVKNCIKKIIRDFYN